MKLAVPAVFALIVATLLTAAALWSVNAAERAYPISAVQAGMRRDPSVWTTHPLLVRGAIVRWLSTPNSCGGRAPGLDTCSPTETLWAQVGTARSHLTIMVPPDARLAVAPAPAPGPLSRVYALPAIGPVIARFFPPRSGGDVTLRVVLARDCTGAASGIPCSDGVLYSPGDCRYSQPFLSMPSVFFQVAPSHWKVSAGPDGRTGVT